MPGPLSSDSCTGPDDAMYINRLSLTAMLLAVRPAPKGIRIKTKDCNHDNCPSDSIAHKRTKKDEREQNISKYEYLLDICIDLVKKCLMNSIGFGENQALVRIIDNY
jgi:hypothetical protein